MAKTAACGASKNCKHLPTNKCSQSHLFHDKTTCNLTRGGGSDDDVRGCKWCGVRGHDWEECFKRLPVAQREMSKKLSATTSGLDSALGRMEDLEKRQSKTEEAVSSIRDIETDVTIIEGQVERLLNWKSDVEKRMSQN